MSTGAGLAAAFAVLSGCTDRQLHAATVVDVALIACDVGQTYYASDGGRWDRPGVTPHTVQAELNPVLGPTPSPTLLVAAALVTVGVTAAVGASHLPRWFRAGYLGTAGVVEGYLVGAHIQSAGFCGMR